MLFLFFVWVLFAASTARAAQVASDCTVEGPYLKIAISPNAGVVSEYTLRAAAGNCAGPGGLLQEGFGVMSYYVPNRRLNESLDVAEAIPGQKVVTYSYDCDGPNIAGLHVTRTMEPIPNEASLRVRWKIENKGDQRQWIAPWVRVPLAPGGQFNSGDRIDLATLSGVQSIERTGYYPAVRNWVAVTDPLEAVTVYGVFHADHPLAFLAVKDVEQARGGFQTAFVPRVFSPGETWETTYRINAVRGLKHVDFATDELAAQLDYAAGKLELRVSAAKPLRGIQIHARVVAENGRLWRLPARAFDIDLNTVVRCTFEWTAPGDGAYDFLAQLTRGAKEAFPLGQDTAPPHGGIDTRFVVGKPRPVRMEPWTDAPFALERGPRTLKRSFASTGKVAVWIEHSLEKVFREDVAESDGRIEATARIQLARNERESFQVVIRPPAETDLHNVTVRCGDLVNREVRAKIDASDIHGYVVAYCPVRVPSNFEGPTGNWPDALLSFAPFTAQGGRCSPIWFTVYAPPKTPAGVYRGPLTISSEEGGAVKLAVEATVYDFELPQTPALRTDFGFRPQMALEGCASRGSTAAQGNLAALYVTDALEHRVTLREGTQLPSDPQAYEQRPAAFEKRVKGLLARGATTCAVPAALLDAPGAARKANAWVIANKLQDQVFCPIGDEPRPDEWPDLGKRMEQWRAAAPDVPMMITTFGLQPFLPGGPCIWDVHTPVLDTINNQAVLSRIKEHHEVWWYVNHGPPRPYANFLVDFQGIEHRMLFWQTWALGIRGVHYWCVNYCEKGRDPYAGLVDGTPVNGDGLLVYPGPKGPVDSIRWEIVRDGIEDYDYLTLLMRQVQKLGEAGGHEALIERASTVLDLKALTPDLTSFTRDPSVLLARRKEIARMILETQKAR